MNGEFVNFGDEATSVSWLICTHIPCAATIIGVSAKAVLMELSHTRDKTKVWRSMSEWVHYLKIGVGIADIILLGALNRTVLNGNPLEIFGIQSFEFW